MLVFFWVFFFLLLAYLDIKIDPVKHKIMYLSTPVGLRTEVNLCMLEASLGLQAAPPSLLPAAAQMPVFMAFQGQNCSPSHRSSSAIRKLSSNLRLSEAAEMSILTTCINFRFQCTVGKFAKSRSLKSEIDKLCLSHLTKELLTQHELSQGEGAGICSFNAASTRQLNLPSHLGAGG